MNEDDSSGANDGLERSSSARSQVGWSQSAASALLFATNVWSAPEEPPPEAAVSPKTFDSATIDPPDVPPQDAPRRKLRPSELAAEARFFSSSGRRTAEPDPAPTVRGPSPQAGAAELAAAPNVTPETEVGQPLPATPASFVVLSPPTRKLSLALQGGGSFGAFTWGVLERLLEEPDCEIDAVSGASVGAVNAALLACGLLTGGREGARRQLARFWNRIINESSFRSLMLIGGFSPAGSSVALGPTLRSGQFDPFDLDPLREALTKDIEFAAIRKSNRPKLLIAATRVRDGRLKIFGNADMTPDVLLASTCPPLIHCAIEIAGEPYWDGGFTANPPLFDLVRGSQGSDVLLVQLTPSRDSYIPITMAAIDRRLDQIVANATLNAEMAGLEPHSAAASRQIFRIAAEDEVDGLAQRSAADLGCSFITLLHSRGRAAADRWLRQGASAKAAKSQTQNPAWEAPITALALELQRRLGELSEA